MRILRAFLRAGVHNLLNAYKMRNGYTARSSALRATKYGFCDNLVWFLRHCILTHLTRMFVHLDASSCIEICASMPHLFAL